MRRAYWIQVTLDMPHGITRARSRFLARPCNAYRQAESAALSILKRRPDARQFVYMPVAKDGWVAAVVVPIRRRR